MEERSKNKGPQFDPFLDRLMETSEAAQWLKVNPRFLLADCKGQDAKVPGFWLNERVVRFHPRTILAKFAFDAGLPPQYVAAMFGGTVSIATSTPTENQNDNSSKN